MTRPGYGFGRTVASPYGEVVERVRGALKEEGFGVITEIDVKKTMKAEPDLGVFLPCNVIVYEAADGTHVSAVDPEAMIGLSGNQGLAQIAAEVKARLMRVVQRL